jgi:hypothetical protein
VWQGRLLFPSSGFLHVGTRPSHGWTPTLHGP